MSLVFLLMQSTYSRFCNRSGIPIAMTAMLLLFGSTFAAAQIAFLERGPAKIDDPGFGIFSKSPTRTFVDLGGRWHWQDVENGDEGTTTVPSSFIGEHSVTFHREFHVDGTLLQQSVFQLAALGISNYCEITINGQFVGKHAGVTSFSMKLPPTVLRNGRNSIQILVSNHLNATETIPLREIPWNPKNYGGIIHDIALIATGPVWVQESYIHCESSGEGKPGTITCKAFLNSGQLAGGNIDSSSGRRGIGKYAVEHFLEVIDIQTGLTVAQSGRKSVVMEEDRLMQVEEAAEAGRVGDALDEGRLPLGHQEAGPAGRGIGGQDVELPVGPAHLRHDERASVGERDRSRPLACAGHRRRPSGSRASRAWR